MKEEKLVLEKQPKSQENYSKPVFIDSDLYKKIVELKAETGLPIRQIVNRFVEYSIEHVEIKEEK
ncbi:hypothetical protein [Companilactobacillus versmoldensis]|uniref:Ribbon-helix-helix protein CopG domain-containing protein n=1 Tax=Companilactobacillus versmoldensis DSM 14857 = KCTC 3814 TaxID=1423815 RepID=A0A0R1SEX7_9LACO|nr:hypothetical protein [Companilactobacillus versmoldensis]KRL68118.1 hypothetical protein FC27_GL000855 [Companilactobacillus versmoldensis DSM 14857 = KCTC 3814]